MGTSRPTRSRFSSPFLPANTTSASVSTVSGSAERSRDKEKERPKTFMDRWVEPPLPLPRPSFADAGIARHGVVANMAPLGTRPSSKIIKSARAGSADSARYSPVAGRKAAGSREAESTPEPSRLSVVTEPEAADSVSAKTESVEIESTLPSTPAQQTSPLDIGSPTPQPDPVSASPPAESNSTTKEVPSAGSGRSAFTINSPQSITSPRSVAALLLAANPPRVHQSPYAPLPPQGYRPTTAQGPYGSPYGPSKNCGERQVTVGEVDRVVEAAVNVAVQQRRWPTAFALRTLYDENRNNARIVRLFDSIYIQTATEEERKEFATLMKFKKRDGKKDKKADYYFNGDGSDFALPIAQPQFQQVNFTEAATPIPSQISPAQTSCHLQPYLTPYANAQQSQQPDLPSTAKVTQQIEESAVKATNEDKSTMAASESTANKDDAMEHPNKQHKGNDFQPSGMEIDKAVNGNGSGNGESSGLVTTPEPSEQTRERSDSVASSTSSLSSLDEGILVAGEAFMSPVRDSHATPRANTNDDAEHASHTQSHDQPISSSKALGPKTHTFSSATPLPPSSSLSNNPSSPPDSLNNEMPSVVAPSSPAQQLPFFKPKKEFNKVTGSAYDADDISSRRKRKAKDVTERSVDPQPSFERHLLATAAEVESSDGGDSAIALPPAKRPRVRLLNTSRRSNYDSEAESSPTLLEFRPDLVPASRSTSRAGTPINSGRPSRREKKSGTGLRVKSSPMKKKGGTAGIPRAGGERSPIANGALPHNQEDNDDYCSACGGNGDLVCCDGCVRSFHFKCVDPPMNQDALPDEWFCYSCLARRDGRLPAADGVFGILQSFMERKNPTSFHLKKDIREYFEGVKTGADGEYEDAAPLEKPKNRAGYEEAPDYFKLKDAKGNSILCHLCHTSASPPNRMIIPCGFCELSWHLDCLDPPLAKEPPLAKKWRCPAHVDDLLADTPDTLGPAHRFRKIKGASVITPAFSRGTKNNGHIEIENTPSDDEDGGFYERREYGRVYKLPERGVKLDFISQVKRKCHTPGYDPRYPYPSFGRLQGSQQQAAGPVRRSVTEQQAALNLAYFASHLADPSQILIDTLLAHAPSAVVDLIAQGDTSNFEAGKISEQDQVALGAMANLIAKLQSGTLVQPKMATPPLDDGKDVKVEIGSQTHEDDAEMLT
ncbi:hypothetical protein BP5796_09911 [Coleophoma crateriformis]|uniref:PHD-type domain-containing protein n=1 Tax=Coleophoma crateriformis TaxID=565419 RepID=A0A3D8QTU8_9HELO|nr:hypothetical protein BP5796_09911 [Coleophoma crateriformis]